MASLNSIYLKAETIKTLHETLQKKGDKGIELTVSINDETNEYGQNISAYVAQTKEQREAKVKRYYVGNGKTFWTDGTITTAERKEQTQAAPAVKVETVDAETVQDDLPF